MAQIRKSNSVMSQWFSGVFEGGEMDLPVGEEAMKTPYGTLTWLSVPPAALIKLRPVDDPSI